MCGLLLINCIPSCNISASEPLCLSQKDISPKSIIQLVICRSELSCLVPVFPTTDATQDHIHCRILLKTVWGWFYPVIKKIGSQLEGSLKKNLASNPAQVTTLKTESEK